MIQALTHTIHKLQGREDFRSQELRANKIHELKEQLKIETLDLTDKLYSNKLTIAKYLIRVEILYNHLEVLERDSK